MTTIWELPAESLGEHIERLTAIEAEADAVQIWQPMLIPGLLQSYGYAAAAIHALGPALPLHVVGERAGRRQQRIDALSQRGTSSITAIIDESALYRPVGGTAALADQMGHLLALEALQPALTLRVLPLGSDAHPGLVGAFTLYQAVGRRAVFREALADTTITTRPEDVAAYSGAWDRLLALALPEGQSLELIDRTRGVLCRRLKMAG